MKRSIIKIFSIVVGWALGTFLSIGLMLVGINIPAMFAKSWSQYSTYSGAVVLVLTVFFSWAMYQVLARRFLDRKVDQRPFLERLPSSVRHPSVVGLVIAWVVAVFTVIVYPVAIYMSWRFYVEWRDAESKVCPRCAERVKAAAMVCRHCGQEFEVSPDPPHLLLRRQQRRRLRVPERAAVQEMTRQRVVDADEERAEPRLREKVPARPVSTNEKAIEAAMEAAIAAEVKATTKEEVLAAQAAQDAIMKKAASAD